MGHEQLEKDSRHVHRIEVPRNSDRETFSGKLIHNREHLKRFLIVGFVKHEVIGPDMISILRAFAYARSVVEPQTTSFGLFVRDFQAFFPPNSVYTLVVYSPAFELQQGCDALVPITPILGRQSYDSSSEQPVFIGRHWFVSVSRSGLINHSASPPLRDSVAIP